MKKFYFFFVIFSLASSINILGKISFWNLSKKDCVVRYRPKNDLRFSKEFKLTGNKLGLQHIKDIPENVINAWIVEIHGKDPFVRAFSKIVNGRGNQKQILIELRDQEGYLDQSNKYRDLPEHIRCSVTSELSSDSD